MPRGGRRANAGAPKANLNAVRTGVHSLRARMAVLALKGVLGTPAATHLAYALVDSGLVNRRGFQRRHLSRVVDFVYRWFFVMSHDERTTREANGRREIARSKINQTQSISIKQSPHNAPKQIQNQPEIEPDRPK